VSGFEPLCHMSCSKQYHLYNVRICKFLWNNADQHRRCHQGLHCRQRRQPLVLHAHDYSIFWLKPQSRQRQSTHIHSHIRTYGHIQSHCYRYHSHNALEFIHSRKKLWKAKSLAILEPKKQQIRTSLSFTAPRCRRWRGWEMVKVSLSQHPAVEWEGTGSWLNGNTQARRSKGHMGSMPASPHRVHSPIKSLGRRGDCKMTVMSMEDRRTPCRQAGTPLIC